jgi:hypothetical protein
LKFEQNYNSVCDISVSFLPTATHTQLPTHAHTYTHMCTRTHMYTRTSICFHFCYTQETLHVVNGHCHGNGWAAGGSSRKALRLLDWEREN